MQPLLVKYSCGHCPITVGDALVAASEQHSQNLNVTSDAGVPVVLLSSVNLTQT